MLALLLATAITVTSAPTSKSQTLLEARAGHVTQLEKEEKSPYSIETPPDDQFELVQYPSELGDMYAYLSKPDQPSGEKLPAIVWLTGGFPVSSPSSFIWEDADISNDQSASIYRYKGIVMLFPTLRGGVSDNPGYAEGFYGEVNDVIRAGEYLKSLPFIDTQRIYLGGHSTGGTLALLVAESTDTFAAILSLGPTDTDYGQEYAPYKWTPKERKLREPISYLSAITSPTYVIEGVDGNHESLLSMQAANQNEHVHFITVADATHFNLIHPVNTLFADAILASSEGTLKIDPAQFAQSYREQIAQNRESADLRILADLRENGLKLDQVQTVSFSLLSRESKQLSATAKKAKELGFTISPITECKNEDEASYHGIELSKPIALKGTLKISRGAGEVPFSDQNVACESR